MSTASGLSSENLATNLLAAKGGGLQSFFTPQCIAVIGASDKAGSIGRTLVWNLISSPFGGTVFPVNPTRPRVLGIKSHPRIGDVPDPVDLAIVATPAPTVPDLIAECVEAGVRAAIIISAGFREIGAEGAELERRIMRNARRGRLRVLGTNSLGVVSPMSGLNAAAASATARPGRIAFLSQSGALGASVLDWGLRANVGFSAFVSVGSQLDVGWGDLIDYFGNDMYTQSIIIYMESIGDARSFVSAARGGTDQADHCHQARPHEGGAAGGDGTHRVADRK